MSKENGNNSSRRSRVRRDQRKRRAARLARMAAKQPRAAEPLSDGGSGGVALEQPISRPTALFERPDECRTDARLARMAIRRRWEPEPKDTKEILCKATEMALEKGATLPMVVAVAKLHLDAHRQIQSDEHHDDRMDYQDRALRLRSNLNDHVGTSRVNIAGGDGSNVLIYLPSQDDDPDEVDRVANAEGMVTEDHSRARERALQAGARIGDSTSNVLIYLPDNGREKVDEDTLVPDPFSRDVMAGESSDDLPGE